MFLTDFNVLTETCVLVRRSNNDCRSELRTYFNNCPNDVSFDNLDLVEPTVFRRTLVGRNVIQFLDRKNARPAPQTLRRGRIERSGSKVVDFMRVSEVRPKSNPNKTLRRTRFECVPRGRRTVFREHAVYSYTRIR